MCDKCEDIVVLDNGQRLEFDFDGRVHNADLLVRT